MLVIDGFDAKPGTTIKVKINSIDAKKDMSTVTGVLKRFEAASETIVKSWNASDLLNGATATLGEAIGYDVIILPVSGPAKNPKMNVTMQSDSGFDQTVDENVGDNVPFGWRIFMQ